MVSQSSLPAWAGRYMHDDERDSVAQAVKDAEARTSAEIVPMMVRRSAGVGHVPRTLALLSALAAFAAWEANRAWELGWPAPLFFAAAAVLGLGVVFGLGRLPRVQRWLSDGQDLAMAAERRAVAEFQASRITATRDATGVLIFVSLLERRAVILADAAVARCHPPETWDRILARLVSHTKNGNLAVGFREAIKEVGAILAVDFPVAPDDVNELADVLVIKE